MPSRGLGGRARRRQREAATTTDWAGGLGTDVLLAIFHRLDHIDILMSADHVCHSWRRAAREEPSLWRRITMRGHEGIARRLNRGGMACEALRRSAEAFCGQYAGVNGFLMYLVEQAPCLKSLRLISCNLVSNEGLTEAVKGLPLLEELELSL
ncbi:F-box protein SKIP19-like [Miscanthus floridulus]|uniref:F-box protein SKIP19-like n=1 Tax=Miscanthus floridulus TaxID=154761 RepID=UPI003457843C